MSEVEKHLYCENCDSSARVIYDPEDVSYEPEVCPFCGENVGTISEEFEEFDSMLDDEDEDLLDELDDDNSRH